eukprot:9503771-Pyramimonas_sp.AAC.2
MVIPRPFCCMFVGIPLLVRAPSPADIPQSVDISPPVDIWNTSWGGLPPRTAIRTHSAVCGFCVLLLPRLNARAAAISRSHHILSHGTFLQGAGAWTTC